eukprot:7011614-Karenia_brevis.AAC.1
MDKDQDLHHDEIKNAAEDDEDKDKAHGAPEGDGENESKLFSCSVLIIPDSLKFDCCSLEASVGRKEHFENIKKDKAHVFRRAREDFVH